MLITNIFSHRARRTHTQPARPRLIDQIFHSNARQEIKETPETRFVRTVHAKGFSKRRIAEVRGGSALNKKGITVTTLFKKPSLRWALLGLALAVAIAWAVLARTQAIASRHIPAAALSGVQSVSMVDEKVGWVLAGTAVLRTADGGAGWVDVTPPTVAGAADAYTAGRLTTVGADAAYVTFTRQGSSSIFVFRTADAGRTWAQAEIPQEPEVWSAQAGTAPPVTAFQFADAQHGWLLATYGCAAGSEAVRVYATTDAGATWQLVDDVAWGGREPAAGSLPFGGHKTGLAFADATRGWVSGFDAGDEIVLYASGDGGRTWARQHVTAPRGYSTEGGAVETRSPIFFGEGSSDGLLPVVFHAEGQPTVFYVTHDGGATWQPTTAVVSAVNDSFVWSFPDPKHGFATDGDKLYVTSDGGATWQAVTPNVSLGGASQLDFVSARTGWAVVGSSLVKTTDGGRTWTQPATGSGN